MQLLKKLLALVLVLSLTMTLSLIPGATAAEDDAATDPTETTAPEVEEVDPNDPYVFVYDPGEDVVIPEYYNLYARPFWYRSAHNVYTADRTDSHDVSMFNLVNTSMLIGDEALAPTGGYASFPALCADNLIPAQAGTHYRLVNLEDGYFCKNSDGTVMNVEAAEHIRAIMRHAYPTVSVADAEAAANAYLTATYGEEAVAVTGLTGGELMTATQAAVWHYTNGTDFLNDPYSDTDDWDAIGELWQAYYSFKTIIMDGPVDVTEKATENTRTNIAGVYEYLINLPGEAVEDIIITDTAISLAGAIKTPHDTTYDLTVLLSINGTINSDDELTLTASFGGQTLTHDLGTTNAQSARSQGLYAITFTDLPENARTIGALSLELSGTQVVHDICFYEAKPTESSNARETSQNMVGAVSTAIPISNLALYDLSVPMTLKITKVDETSGKALPGVAFDLYMNKDGEALKLNTYITDENGMISVDVSDDGYEYYFVEAEALPGYVAVDGNVTTGTVTNRYESGELEISKKVINISAAQDYEFFRFNVTLDLSNAPLMQNSFDWLTADYIATVLRSSKELNWTVAADGCLTADFTLQADESISIAGIPTGTVYTVTEILTEEDRLAFSVTTEVTAGDGAAVEGSEAAVSGTIAEENAVLYTNEFEEVQETTVPETTIPETTVPETTVPETTIPEITTPETTVPATTVPRDVTNPSTGDPGVSVMLLICVLSAALTVTLYVSKRPVV